MLMFTLAISCLTTSNLPWFKDLTVQVPMQYCSLQHQTLLLSPVTSTAGYCFCFGSIPSFFLELFLHWSPVAYWAPNDLGFLGGSDGKESACHAGDLGSIPGSGRSPGGGNGKPLQYSCLENPMNSMKRQNDRILKEELPRSLKVKLLSGVRLFATPWTVAYQTPLSTEFSRQE